MRPDPNYINDLISSISPSVNISGIQQPPSASAPPIPELSPVGTGREIAPDPPYDPQEPHIIASPQGLPNTGIASLLQPIINMAGRQHAAVHQDKIPTYINEVTEITDRTFPDLDYSNSLFGSSPITNRATGYISTPQSNSLFDFLDRYKQIMGTR